MAFVLVESLAHNKGKVVKIAIKALEILFLSAGIISTLLLFKGSFMPYYSCQILLVFWNSLLSSPLFIGTAINFTILLIALSSRVHFHKIVDDHDHDHNHDHDHDSSSSPPQHNQSFLHDIETKDANNDGRPNEEDDTMDATWKAITVGGKEKREAKREQVMKKSETWDGVGAAAASAPRRIDSEELFATKKSYSAWKDLRKSETFNDAVSIMRRGGLRRDPITSLDELNNKVEAFIRKINQNTRLQRLESDQRFLDMFNNRSL
ncbi:Protein of unknown function (DUF761) [Abeliophyllum distichum]|uniref:Uncharacterized protein n=1 Tax=Abeliophyllum distichum TaxID=126358 RepID=A0ABD1VTM7_9LAMI